MRMVWVLLLQKRRPPLVMAQRIRISFQYCVAPMLNQSHTSVCSFFARGCALSWSKIQTL